MPGVKLPKWPAESSAMSPNNSFPGTVYHGTMSNKQQEFLDRDLPDRPEAEDFFFRQEPDEEDDEEEDEEEEV